MSNGATGAVLGLLVLAAACGMDGPGQPGRSGVAREAATASAEPSSSHGRERVLSASLHGVPRPYTGATNAIRGVPGGGLPWVVGEGKATLLADGTLRLEVEGLVFDPDDAAAIARGVAGTNTVAQGKAVVSCLSVQDGAAVTVNVSSALVPFSTGAAADGGGNASVEEQLALPSPCLAPIVFFTSPAGAWFAGTGF